MPTLLWRQLNARFHRQKLCHSRGLGVSSACSFMEPPQSQTPPLNELINQRRAKLDALRAKGIDPFKNKFTPQIGCGEARAKYVAKELKDGEHVEIAGRITAHRDMGKSQFMDLKDVSGRIQIYA